MSSDPLADYRTLQRVEAAHIMLDLAYPALTKSAGAREAYLAAYDDELLARLWKQCEPHSVVDLFRARHLLAGLVAALEQPGDVIECGVAGGGTALLLGLALRELAPERTLFLCDSFEGLPEPDPTKDRQYAAGDYACARPVIEALLAEHGLTEHCVLVEGWFSDTLADVVADRIFAFAHIDCDLYTSCRDCLDHVMPHMAPRGYVVFDDYHDGSRGVWRAVNEYLAGSGERLHLGPMSQVTLVTGEKPQAGQEEVTLHLNPAGMPSPGGDSVTFCLDALHHDQAFQAFVGQARGFWAGRLELLEGYCRLMPG